MRPRGCWFTLRSTSLLDTAFMGTASRAGPLDVPAKSESPFAPFRCYRSGSDVSHHLTGHYPSVLATTSSCARSITLLLASQLSWSIRSLPVAVGPGGMSILPDLTSANPSPDVWPPIPAGPSVHLLVSSLRTSAFPTLGTARLSQHKHASAIVLVQKALAPGLRFWEACGPREIESP